ncbi:MAG: holo-ACP synthase [Armatimonadota bacterium]|jgi:holo-[acyl-carrier protein] synthase
MIVGTGVDVIKVERVAHLLEGHGERFTRKIYTEAEVERCSGRRNQAQEYAARWAAKEATMKALGTGWRQGVRFKDIENYNLRTGKPMIRLHGRAKELAEELGATRIHVSLSHEREYAVAFVILEA